MMIRDNQNQKLCMCLNDQVDELLCPITMELPVDPVMAEDGRIYERAAIEEVIRQNRNSLKSPVTNQRMGTRLYPSIQTKNIILMILKSGAIIDKSKIEKWNEKIDREKTGTVTVQEMRKRAESGEVKAMANIGHCYNDGLFGFDVDRSKAYYWLSKAAEAGDAIAMARSGYLLRSGKGIEKDVTEGMCMLYSAAIAGSDDGAYYVGYAYLRGKYGFPKNIIKAKKWLTQAVEAKCKFRSLSTSYRSEAKEQLDQLTEHFNSFYVSPEPASFSVIESLPEYNNISPVQGLSEEEHNIIIEEQRQQLTEHNNSTNQDFIGLGLSEEEHNALIEEQLQIMRQFENGS